MGCCGKSSVAHVNMKRVMPNKAQIKLKSSIRPEIKARSSANDKERHRV